MQAQCSVNQASLVSQPRTWWFSFASKSIPVSRSGRDEVRMSTLKTAELLDRTKLHLCQIFKCSAEMTPGVGATEEEDEEEEEEELPDCVEGENGIILTDLGRMQIINEVRRFRVEYQGDPDLQPVRSYECTLLVELMAWIASHINKQFESQMGTLCSRQDLAGSVCRHLLLSPLNESGRAQKRSPALARPRHEQRRGPRVSLRVLASYRTLLCLLLMYLLGCILSWSPLLLCGLVVLLLAVLDPLGPMLIRWSKKCKHVPP
ncbi:sphingomyelin phosphodiesterase 4-like [Clupea harengus]|uniref:Sphingomyelin phosphodiesterase 4-like n=1 Tax=Clupea harengus TaxID=7950 RepID=A0A6P8FRU1_CLUHA|nr:sphingomyelin phosphodiesterase 4-like [Clupea harengus]